MLSHWLTRPNNLGALLVRLLVKGDVCLGEGWACLIGTNDRTALTNYRLVDTTLCVTLELCVMCIGAISHARVKRPVFDAPDPKRGTVCRALALSDADLLNYHVPCKGGVLALRCEQLVKEIFARRGRLQSESLVQHIDGNRIVGWR